jgi:hypothetical protein
METLMSDIDKLSRLADQMEIQDLMARYTRCVDRAQWAGLRDIYHPDATDDHGAYVGNVEGFIEWVSRRHAAIPEAMHFLGNCLMEFADRDTARAFALAADRSQAMKVLLDFD